LSVDHLKAAAQQLSSDELQAFTAWLVAWQQKHYMLENEDAALIEAVKMRLPAEDVKRLKRLIAKSERGVLTPKELETYRTLAQQAEQLNAKRMEALAELARRQDKPANLIMQELGWESGEDGA
jgi:superfamily I DNA and/or RNA helicase